MSSRASLYTCSCYENLAQSQVSAMEPLSVRTEYCERDLFHVALWLGSGTGTRRGFKIQLSYPEISLSQHSFGLDVSLWSLS